MSFVLQKEIQPASYSVLMKALDGLEGYYDGHLAPAIYRDNILELAPLPFRRLWNVTVLAHNCKEHQITKSFELGDQNSVSSCKFNESLTCPQ